MTSRAVLVLGMHRSGTSAVSRALQALSVHLGENFFETQPDNPTGYWEDKALVAINQRVLEELRLAWDDTDLIARDRFRHHRIRLVQLHAVRYLERAFASQPLWGFKDPRTIRLLPFWPEVVRKCDAEDAYVLSIRHPLSVAASLFRRQEIPLAKAQRLWLVHNVPFLHEVRDRRLVVVDYDLLTNAPQAQLERIARKLALPLSNAAIRAGIDGFATTFLAHSLRHNVFGAGDFDSATAIGRLAQRAYLALYDLASDRRSLDSRFWSDWGAVADELSALTTEELDRAP